MNIRVKKRQCKGVGLAKCYMGCGNSSYIEKYGLCSSCYAKWLLNTDEGQDKLKKHMHAAGRKSKIIKKGKIKQEKIKTKTIAVLKMEARAPFQKLIRIRDHGRQCVCCDSNLPFNIGNYDGGHYFKAELYSGVIFHPHNVNGQRVYCNKYNHGNELGYGQGLSKKIGNVKYNELLTLARLTKDYKWGRDELIELKTYYNKELRQVENGKKNISKVNLNKGIRYDTNRNDM